MMAKKMRRSLTKGICGCTAALMALGLCMSAPEAAICRAEGKNQSVNAKEKVISGSCLNIGSVSKMYVVTAVMQLVDQGKVSLDAPVTDYIPDFQMADERSKKITVRMLMNHTSGLMGTVYCGMALFDEADNDYHDALLQKLRREQLKYEPGAFNCYCNDGFTLLEILTERVSNMSFTEYLEENICRPLSLQKTGTVWNMNLDCMAPIYVNGNIKMAPECEQAIGAGGIISTAEEVCSFGSAFFKGNGVLLSEKAKKVMAENYRTGCPENFGLGWDEVTKKDYEKAGVTVLSKGGDTFFQHASLVVAPDAKISVAVLSSGGGSGLNEEMALELMDIALSEQGTKVDHPVSDAPQLSDSVPEEYLSYQGLYADTQRTVEISFPNGKYLQIVSVTSDQQFEEQYAYAKDGMFVKVNGDIQSGKAIPVRPVQALTFEEKDGQVYIADPDFGYMLYKAPANNVSDKVQTAWDQRDEVSYYLVNGRAGDATYSLENCCFTLHTDEAARGYVNGYVMQDEDHACFMTIMPGTSSRDLSNLQVERVDGKEYLCLNEYDYRYVSEENIPVLTEELTGVDLKTKEASWFKIEGAKNMTLRLEVPEKAAVYVYDQYGNVRYSSFMMEYGNEVPLPEYGMIVFIGETGQHVGIDLLN